MNHLVAGALVYGALYCASVFVTGLLTGNRTAMLLAIVTMGISYLSFVAQIGNFATWSPHAGQAVRVFAFALIVLSMVSGMLAGIALLP